MNRLMFLIALSLAATTNAAVMSGDSPSGGSTPPGPGTSSGGSVLQDDGFLQLITTQYLSGAAFGASSTIQIDIIGPNVGEYDRLVGVAPDPTLLFLNGSLNVTLHNGYVPTAGTSFDLFDGQLIGGFSAVYLPEVPGLIWDTTQLTTSGVLSINVIPEPLVLGGVMTTMAWVLLRRKVVGE